MIVNTSLKYIYHLAGGRVLCNLVDDGAVVEVAVGGVADDENNIPVIVDQLVCGRVLPQL